MVDPTEPTPMIAMVCFMDKPFKKKSRTKAGLSQINTFTEACDVHSLL